MNKRLVLQGREGKGDPLNFLCTETRRRQVLRGCPDCGKDTPLPPQHSLLPLLGCRGRKGWRNILQRVPPSPGKVAQG